MVTALLAFAPAPKEAGLAGMDFVIVAAALVNLAVFALLLWWMYRAVVALEGIAKSQERTASVHEREFQAAHPPVPRGKPGVDTSSPTRNLLGCLALGLAIATSSGCAGDDGEDMDGSAEGGGEGDDGAEPNGVTTERACFDLTRCDANPNGDACSLDYSDEATMRSDDTLSECGPAPAGDVGSTAWLECALEQCGCSGFDPATGATVCE